MSIVDDDFDPMFDNSAVPKQFEQCVKVYKAMEDQAVMHTEGLMWEGSLTVLFKELEIPMASYTIITRFLKGMNCIKQLRRGGGPVSSLWVLRGEPTIELYRAVRPTVNKKQRGGADVSGQRVRDLARRVTALEETVESLKTLIRRGVV